MPRQWLVIVHRYVGLVMAGFLVIAGLTGALLVWYHEIDRMLNPHLLQVQPPDTDTAPLSPFALRDKVDAAFPGATVDWMTVRQASADSPYQFYVEAEKADAPVPEVDEVYVNPYSGEILGGRRWGDLSQGLTNLMPFVYRLHYSLALGTIGTWVFGLIAVLWTLDCFVGAYLTLPPRRSKKRWWKRWSPAWKIRWRRGRFKRHYDYHRAGGLWPWALLLVFAWSGVAMNLYAEIYRPTTALLLDFQDHPLAARAAHEAPPRLPEIGWETGFTIATERLNDLATEQGLTTVVPERFAYYPEEGALKLMASTDRDINERFGQSWLYIDASSGELIGFYLPTGHAAGDTLTTWITNLHTTTLGGLTYRILVTLLGMVVILLSLTGVLIWWRKRQARRRARKRSATGGGAEDW